VNVPRPSTDTVIWASKLPAAPEAEHDGRRKLPPPGIVKRNTLLLAASQAFVGVGNQMVPTLGAIIVARLLGAAHLAGMAASTLGVSRLLVSYPIGRVADAYGRRIAVVVGLLLGLAGALGTGLSVLLGSFVLFLASILVFGAGVSASYQLRVAAADMYPPSQRAQGLGYVLTGSLVGALGAPVLITAAQAWSGALNLDPVALTWILVPTVIVPGIGLVLAVQPDPKEIAANLERYYPGYRAPRLERTDGTAATGVLSLLCDPRLQVAFTASFAAQGNMSMIMAFTSLAAGASRTSAAGDLGCRDHPRHRHVRFLAAPGMARRSDGPWRNHAPGISLPGGRGDPRARHVSLLDNRHRHIHGGAWLVCGHGRRNCGHR
jgi:MFS family permease